MAALRTIALTIELCQRILSFPLQNVPALCANTGHLMVRKRYHFN